MTPLYSLDGFFDPKPHSFSLDFASALFGNDFTALFPELFLLSTTLFLLLYGVWMTTEQTGVSVLTPVIEKELGGGSHEQHFPDHDKKDRPSGVEGYPILVRHLSWFSKLALLVTILLVVKNPIVHGVFCFHTFVIDDGTLFFKLLVLSGGFLTLSIAQDSLEQEKLNGFEFPILILLSTASMLFLISSADFLSMYLAIEFQSLCFYVLAAFKRNSEFSTEAGLKYFLLGVFSSGLLLFGCSLLYGFTGLVDFGGIAHIFSGVAVDTGEDMAGYYGSQLGMVFLFIGFLFKLTAVPFHMWAPDVYEGSPMAVTAFFSIVPKASFLFVFTRLLYQSFFDFLAEWQTLLILSSLCSMILGSFSGLAQQKIKRLFAYSGIGHVGYLLIALSCGSVESLQALVVYLVIYMIMTLNLFTVLLIPVRRSEFSEVSRIKYTTDLALLGKTNPLLAGSFAIGLFSLAGIPPLAGFYSKAFLFWTALNSSQYLLALVGILTSVISCFYYIRLIKIMYFETPKEWISFAPVSKAGSLVLGLTTLFLLFFMIYPSPLSLASHKVALSLTI